MKIVTEDFCSQSKYCCDVWREVKGYQDTRVECRKGGLQQVQIRTPIFLYPVLNVLQSVTKIDLTPSPPILSCSSLAGVRHHLSIYPFQQHSTHHNQHDPPDHHLQ